MYNRAFEISGPVMLFKNAYIYRITQSFEMSAGQLGEKLAGESFVPELFFLASPSFLRRYNPSPCLL